MVDLFFRSLFFSLVQQALPGEAIPPRESSPRKAENKTRALIRARCIGEPFGRPTGFHLCQNLLAILAVLTTYEDSAKFWAPLSGITKPSAVISRRARKTTRK
ncbi:hypothetical protein MRX96_036883 [Rhipicephalus microplus]